GREPGRSPSQSRPRGAREASRGPDADGSGIDTWATYRAPDVDPEDSSPSEHPDPHANLFRGEPRFQLDDRVLPVATYERVDFRDFHLEELFEGLFHLVAGRLPPDEELESVYVFPFMSRVLLRHFLRLFAYV